MCTTNVEVLKELRVRQELSRPSLSASVNEVYLLRQDVHVVSPNNGDSYITNVQHPVDTNKNALIIIGIQQS